LRFIFIGNNDPNSILSLLPFEIISEIKKAILRYL